MKVMTVPPWPIERPENVPFSSRHKARFQELREIGELYAINVHDERPDLGLWRVKSDIRDSDLVGRLRRRFQAAVRRAAIDGGAPYRVNLVDWWISQLALGRALHFIQGLMERSIEFCE